MQGCLPPQSRPSRLPLPPPTTAARPGCPASSSSLACLVSPDPVSSLSRRRHLRCPPVPPPRPASPSSQPPPLLSSSTDLLPRDTASDRRRHSCLPPPADSINRPQWLVSRAPCPRTSSPRPPPPTVTTMALRDAITARRAVTWQVAPLPVLRMARCSRIPLLAPVVALVRAGTAVFALRFRPFLPHVCSAHNKTANHH